MVVTEDYWGGLRLMERMIGYDRAIVIDAARSGSVAGTVRRIEVGRDPVPVTTPPTSSHGAGLIDAIDLARALDRLPDELVVLAVEAGDLSTGAGLTPTVGAALPEVVEQAIAESRR